MVLRNPLSTRWLAKHYPLEIAHMGKITLRSFRLHYGIWIGACLLAVYAAAVFLDLPTPAGNRYQQNLPDRVLIAWGATPLPTAQHATHWWYKTQGLRGWSANPEGWAWARVGPSPILHWIILLGMGLLGTVGLMGLERYEERRPRLVPVIALIVFVIFSYGFQILTLQMKSVNSEQLLLDRITDKFFTGYYDSAFQFDDLQDYFSKYGTTLKNPLYCSHCQTHPPGPVLFYWSIHHVVDSLPASWQQEIAKDVQVDAQVNPAGLAPDAFIVAWLGANLILLAAATIVIPLYGLARRLGTRKLVLPLTALGAVIPGIILMSPQFDQVYAMMTAWLFYLAIRGLDTSRQNFSWGLITGLVFAYSLYWSTGLLVLAAPLVMLIPFALAGKLTRTCSKTDGEPGKLTLIAAGRWLIGLGLGVFSPWVLLIVIGKFPLWQQWLAIERDHLHGITAVRPYVPWLVFNLVDFVQFLGIPLAVVTLILLFRRHPTGSDPEPTARPSGLSPIGRTIARVVKNANVFGFLFWLVIIVLDLSGTTRGEVGRLWIFLMPMALLAVYFATGREQLTKTHVHLLLAAQFVVCAVIGGNWLTP